MGGDTVSSKNLRLPAGVRKLLRQARPDQPSLTASSSADVKALNLASHSQAALMAERAVSRGIQVKKISPHTLELHYENVVHRFRSGRSTLNTLLARRCLAQKEVTSRLLRQRNLPAPENAVFGKEDVHRAWRWAEPILPVVLKPNTASKGKLVHVGVKTFDKFQRAFQVVAAEFGQVLVEQHLEGAEHRFTVIDGRVFAITQRRPPHVVGDGRSTVSELITLKNEERRTRNNPLHHKPLIVDDAVRATLADQGLGLDSVPPAGSLTWLRYTSNISLGGEAIDKTDLIDQSIKDLVEQANRAIPGLRLAGFDVLIPEDPSQKPAIIEINSSPMLTMHVYPWEGQPRNVYDAVLDVMFPMTMAAAGA